MASENEKKDPQASLEDFWSSLLTKTPGKVTNIFPPSLYANLLPPLKPKGPAKGINAAKSYEAAAEDCRNKVKRIVRECHRTNEKFTDPDFDIEDDLGTGQCLKGLLDSGADTPPPGAVSTVDGDDLRSALNTLAESGIVGSALTVDVVAVSKVLNAGEGGRSEGPDPKAVHRVDWIYEKPQFAVDGFSSSDVRQGGNGDCWWVAAVATLCTMEHLMERVCVARDEECGVYGFVFHRDGEWFSTVVDDNLYLRQSDFDAYVDIYDPTGEKEKKWRKSEQTGSEALYFAHCANENETWLPLLEKAYAKVHGDFDAIAGGWSGEAVEDMTGGVTTTIFTNKILSKERLWKELLNEKRDFLFAASSPSLGSDSESRRGLALGHAYSVLKAIEEEDENGNKVRLVLIRNPWGARAWTGIGEWNGPWSDGSKEWTPYWLKKLDYQFGDDGMFWMSYDDLRSRFDILNRTRLFSEDWTVVQQWTSLSIGWVTGYLNTKFLVEIKQSGPTVFVLSQLDDRYFRGLEGQYTFELHFLLQEEGAPAGEHLVRARSTWFGTRSVSAEVDLEPGRYEVIPKIAASRDPSKPEVQDIVKKYAEENGQKLRQIGMNYDIANAKGIIELTEEEKAAKEKKAKDKADKGKAEKDKEAADKAEFEEWKKAKAEKEKKAAKAAKKGGEKTKEVPQKEEEKSKKPEAEKERVDDKADQGKSKKAESSSEDEDSETPDSDDDDSDESSQQGESSAKTDKETPAKPAAPEALKPATSKVSEQQTLKPPSALPFRGGPSAPSPPGSVYDGPPMSEIGSYAGAYADADAAAPPPPEPARPATEANPNPWNAICVVGLKVYARDKDVSIKLIKPKSLEEGAMLDVDGATAAGATM
ncbi:cysteine proteinase [Mytilinidion resinicola]|uniref:Cysteine proteinase n=1 Tax=Mytilinidion resinicola TaxID=574789 RepID=A0A6A6Z7P5_9PEZI|nr:cysteine proteinase [Mytilinidion resinicola]KAF2816818.1 cysteine proteinase [Mytilinidion resinicola]